MSHQKKQKHDSLLWQPVSVELPSSSSAVPKEEAESVEPMAMFVGLEVLDGSKFRVETKNNTKFMTILDQDATIKGTNEKNKYTSTTTSSTTENATTTKKKKKKKAKQKAAAAAAAAAKAKAVPLTDVEEEATPTKEAAAAATAENTDAVGANNNNKNNQKRKATESTTTTSNEQDHRQDSLVQNLQTLWMMATGGVVLPLGICSPLWKQGFVTPTPIQANSLAAATYGRRNIVGAAPTGSGKTLAYLLPIAMRLLEQEQSLLLRALILTPTRELALQVGKEWNKISNKKSGVLVGGMALAKQERILQKVKPSVLVATPGRLWDLMSSSEQYEHLQNLSRLEFLVIDEADRMVLHHKSFPQLHSILREVHLRSGGSEGEQDDDDDEDSDSDGDEERLLGLPGIRGEVKTQMLTPEMLQQLNEQQQQDNDDKPEPIELEDDEFERLQQEQQQENESDNDDDGNHDVGTTVQRQTFVFSATLTLPPTESYKKQGSKGKHKKKQEKSVEGGIAEILETARAKGPTKIVDLTSLKTTTPKMASVSSTNNNRLPPGLSLRFIKCTQRHKDSYLYAYLVTTAQGASGPCLVFCNSIAAVRRVGATLQTLKLPVRMLHAQMAQKARFKAVESLKQPKSRAIVVATDVAARGLDIPSVATVIHYDVARAPDTFIHRAGRTARGMGEGAVGSSLSLVAPAEAKMHDKICKALAGDDDDGSRLWEPVVMDGRLLSLAQERVALATKVVSCEALETKTQKHNSWLEQAASDAGLDLDDDVKEEGLAGGTQRERQQLQQAQQAKAKLRQLLAIPMQTQRYGKFLSSNTAAVQTEVKPYVVDERQPKRKRRRKK